MISRYPDKHTKFYRATKKQARRCRCQVNLSLKINRASYKKKQINKTIFFFQIVICRLWRVQGSYIGYPTLLQRLITPPLARNFKQYLVKPRKIPSCYDPWKNKWFSRGTQASDLHHNQQK